MIKSRSKTRINCIDCEKEIAVRNDSLKKHKKICSSCAKKRDWENSEYREKCRKAHLGQIVNPPLPYGEANFNSLLHSYKKGAFTRGIDWSLTREQFKYLTKQKCYYCGVEAIQKHSNEEKFKYGLWLYNGVDRKDDARGYEIDNCVPCCKKCNYMKQGLTDIEFFNHIFKIHKFHAEVDTLGSREIGSK